MPICTFYHAKANSISRLYVCVCFYVIHFINQWLRKQNTIVFAGRNPNGISHRRPHVQKQDLSEYVLILLFTWVPAESPCSMKRRFSSKSNVATVDLYRNDRPLILIMFGMFCGQNPVNGQCAVSTSIYSKYTVLG